MTASWCLHASAVEVVLQKPEEPNVFLNTCMLIVGWEEAAVPDNITCSLQGVQAVWEGWQHAEGPLQERHQSCWQGSSIEGSEEQAAQFLLNRIVTAEGCRRSAIGAAGNTMRT